MNKKSRLCWSCFTRYIRVHFRQQRWLIAIKNKDGSEWISKLSKIIRQEESAPPTEILLLIIAESSNTHDISKIDDSANVLKFIEFHCNLKSTEQRIHLLVPPFVKWTLRKMAAILIDFNEKYYTNKRWTIGKPYRCFERQKIDCQVITGAV